MIEDTEWQTKEPITAALKTWQALQQSMDSAGSDDQIHSDKEGHA